MTPCSQASPPPSYSNVIENLDRASGRVDLAEEISNVFLLFPRGRRSESDVPSGILHVRNIPGIFVALRVVN